MSLTFKSPWSLFLQQFISLCQCKVTLSVSFAWCWWQIAWWFLALMVNPESCDVCRCLNAWVLAVTWRSEMSILVLFLRVTVLGRWLNPSPVNLETKISEDKQTSREAEVSLFAYFPIPFRSKILKSFFSPVSQSGELSNMEIGNILFRLQLCLPVCPLQACFPSWHLHHKHSFLRHSVYRSWMGNW